LFKEYTDRLKYIILHYILLRGLLERNMYLV